MKKLFAVMMIVFLLVGTFSTATTAEENPEEPAFTDIAGLWCEDSVRQAYRYGLMSGTSATTFQPDMEMTRAMLATVLYRMDKMYNVNALELPGNAESGFSDVPSDTWYSQAIAWAKQTGVVAGTGATTFSPNLVIPRQQTATMVFRYVVYLCGDAAANGDLTAFVDGGMVADYAKAAMVWAVKEHILYGTSEYTLSPSATTTRGQFAAIASRLMHSLELVDTGSELPLNSAEQVYALGRLLAPNRAKKDVFPESYSTSAAGGCSYETDLGLFQIPAQYVTREEKIGYLRTAKYALTRNISVEFDTSSELGATSGFFWGIGSENYPFAGSINGCGHIITINGTGDLSNIALSGNSVGFVARAQAGAALRNIRISVVKDVVISKEIAIGTRTMGVLCGNMNSISVSNCRVSLVNADFGVDTGDEASGLYVYVGGICGYSEDCSVSNVNVNIENGALLARNTQSVSEVKPYLAAGVAAYTKYTAFRKCHVSLTEGSILAEVKIGCSSSMYFATAAGGIVGFSSAGASNSPDDPSFGKIGNTFYDCSFKATNQISKEVLSAKQTSGTAPNVGGIAAISFNTAIIKDCGVAVTNGSFIASRLEDSEATVYYSACAAGIVGRMEHTGRIADCSVVGNCFEIAAQSTGRNVFAGGIAGESQNPWHKNVVPLENCTVRGNGTTTIRLTVIEGSAPNSINCLGGIAGAAAYVVKNCDVSDVTLVFEGIKNASEQYAGTLIGWFNLTQQWCAGTYFTPDKSGVYDCDTDNVEINLTGGGTQGNPIAYDPLGTQ